MKKSITAGLALLCVCMIILGGCSSAPETKTFSFESPQKITVTSISGEKMEVTDEDIIQQITDNITSIRFERGESSEDTNGFGSMISWYDTNGDMMETISVMSDDTIIYNSYFWTAMNGSIDIEVINDVLSTILEANQDGEEDWEDKALLEDTEYSDINAEELADTFGIMVSLPENTTWITDSEYCLVDENNLKITYHDTVADADCTLLVAKNENLNLPDNEYDETLNESWEGKTISGQNIVVKVQHGKNDENKVLATWEYNEYRFAIIGEVKEISESIPKVALSIIYKLD
ncbi:hypothetical protein AALA90_10180 [Lachnospiraceae bacterium 38-10]